MRRAYFLVSRFLLLRILKSFWFCGLFLLIVTISEIKSGNVIQQENIQAPSFLAFRVMTSSHRVASRAEKAGLFSKGNKVLHCYESSLASWNPKRSQGALGFLDHTLRPTGRCKPKDRIASDAPAPMLVPSPEQPRKPASLSSRWTHPAESFLRRALCPPEMSLATPGGRLSPTCRHKAKQLKPGLWGLRRTCDSGRGGAGLRG